jgi:hypothetical protein
MPFPGLMARANALDATPEIFRTVFAERGGKRSSCGNGRLMPVTLYRFARQFLFRVFREELVKKSGNRFGSGASSRPAFSNSWRCASSTRL